VRNALLTIGLISILSCSKTDLVHIPTVPKSVCFDCSLLAENYRDSTEHPTILGEYFKNPYLVPNMTAAYRNVYRKTPPPLEVTHLYVKFSPSGFSELDRLEQEDIDLFDYPLDQELVTEGDYYEQPGKGPEDIPDFYAVVESNYVFPSGIKVEVIAKMHIPANDPALENEALKLTNTLYDYGLYGAKSEPTSTEDRINPAADCSHNPSGKIMVRNELLNDQALHPVPGVRIVIRRLFKIDRLYTDENGEFRSNKYYRNKYTILAKFKNEKAHISRTRPKRIFEQFFPVKINLGKWDNLDCLHEFKIEHVNETGTIAASHWCAATTHHAVWEYHQLCNKNSINTPPRKLKIILSSKKGSNHGNTYMMQSIMEDNTAAFIAGEVLLIGSLTAMNPLTGAAVIAVTEFLRRRSPDIYYGYGGDPSYLTTDRYNELVMHELAHASHYTAVGTVWWANFGLAEATNKGEGTYGECCTEKAGLIALGEGWAYMIGHLFTDKLYGMKSTPFPEQGLIDENRNVLVFSNQGNISSHIHFLESYDPNRKLDPSSWVPKGLFYDMMDPRIELFDGSSIKDEVSGYQCNQIFSLFNKDMKNMRQFKVRFIERYGGQQKQALDDLFLQYGY
jgi:hypothetical protein